jgi:hypothetical protein
MKNFIAGLIKAVIIVAISLFMAATCPGQSYTTVEFYFPVSSADLNQKQIDSIMKLDATMQPVEIYGYANTLNNLTGENNESLALRRAEAVSAIVDLVPTASYVVAGDAEMRKVVIVFASEVETVNTMDNNRTELGTVIGTLKTSDDKEYASEDTFSSGVSPIAEVIETNRTLTQHEIDSLARQEYLSTLNSYELAVDSAFVQIPTQESQSCGCGVNNSLEQTFAKYKALQKEAFSYTHTDNRKREALLWEARQVLTCYETMFKAYKSQQRSAKASADSKSTSSIEADAKAKALAKMHAAKSKGVRQFASAKGRLNDNIWSKIFPFRGC